ATILLSPSTGSITYTGSGSTTSTSSLTVVTDLVNDHAGNSIFVGAATVSGQGDNIYVQKIDYTLATLWTYTFNGIDNLDDVAKSVVVDASNNIYVTGFTKSATQGRNMVTIKLNSSGVMQWTKYYNDTLNGDDESMDMVIDANDDIYITGYHTNTLDNKDYYTVKYNSSGTKLWEVTSDGNSTNDKATNMTLDSLNNVIVSGQSEIAPGTYEYVTVRYVQRDVITPTDCNGEAPSPNFMYYANRGQIVDTTYTAVPDIKYYTNNTYPAFYFKNTSQSFVFARIDTIAATSDTLHRIDLVFPGCDESSKIYPLDKQKDGYLNYFLGHLDSNGVTGVFGNQRLITQNLYNNIDLMCSSNQNGIKYYFIIKPGGDIRDIQMQFNGASSFTLDGTSNALSINSSIGHLTFDRPTAYQLTTGNATVAVTGWTPDWTTNGAANKYKFNDGAYTSSLTLVIEVDQGNGTTSSAAIQNLTWSTFYGGGSDDVFYDVKTNSSNNVWVTGYSISSNFPVSVGATQGINNGNSDAVFVKFSNTGTRMWATYIGGSLNECDFNPHGIEVDNLGNSYSAFGTLSTNFPVHASTISGAYYDNVNATTVGHSPQDIAIVSFDNNGQLTWSTYFGGNGWIARSYDIGLDGNNNLFVTGIDNGFPIITPSGAYNNSFPISSGGAYFIAEFSKNHNLIWSTFFGSNGPIIEKIAFNSINDLIISGSVNNGTGAYYDAVDFGSGAYYDDSFNGTFDGFIARFSGENRTLDWSTLYGGNNDDFVHAITVDNNDNIYVSGETQSTASFISGNSFGINNTSFFGLGSYFSRPLGDAFLTKFNSTNQLISDTYFGGTANEGSFDIHYKNNKLFVPFITAGNDMPFNGSNASTAFVQSSNSDGQDVSNDGFFAVMDANFNFIWTSYFGGTNSGSASTRDDQILSNVATNDNKYYIVGSAKSLIGFPQIPGSGYTQNKASSLDGFIAQFNIATSLVGVRELKQELNNDLFIYPNPASNYLNVQYKSSSKYNIEIYNIIGQQVFEKQNINSNFIKLDISNFAKGSYIVKINDNGKLTTQKLIIN
ncbi:MAG: T9SS type A sorting domain-containing protein, partial [Bacteroidetes bacterium]|nr:T9SS type A sorting domain-containing protein [Bacteroidota bacterium]